MSKPGLVKQIADACNVDPKTVRNALSTAGADVNVITFDEGCAIVRDVVDMSRVSAHQATRAAGNDRQRDALARINELKARQLELEIAEREGRLVSREAVAVSGEHVLTALRTTLLKSFGHRVAPKIAGKNSIEEITAIVDAEMFDVFGALSNADSFLEDEALS